MDSLRLVLPVGHNSAIEDIIIDKNSNYILSFSRSNSAILHSVHSGKEILRFNSDGTKKYFSGCFSKNSRFLAMANEYGVEIIDLSTGECSENIETNKKSVKQLEFINNDQKLFFLSEDSTLNTFEFQNKKMSSLKLNGQIDKIQINPNGNEILLSYIDKNDEKVYFVNLKTQNIQLLNLAEDSKLVDFKFCGDRYILFTFTNQSKSSIYLYDRKKQNNKFNRDFSEQIYKTEVNNNKKIFLTVLSNHTIKLFDLRNGDFLKELTGHKYFITDAKFNHNGNMVASCAWDSTFIIYNISNLHSNYTSNTFIRNNKLNLVNFDFSGDLLVVGGFDRVVSLYNFKEKGIKFNLRGLSLTPTSCRFNFNGKTILSSFNKDEIIEINITNGQIENKYSNLKVASSAPNYNNKGNLFATTFINGNVNIYKVGEILPFTHLSGQNNTINSTSFSNNSLLLALTSGNIENVNSEMSVRIIKISNNETLDFFKTKGIARSAKFSCDDQSVIIAYGKADIYNLDSKSVTHSFINNRSWITSADYGFECKIIMVACEDGTIYIYNNNDFSLVDSIKIEGMQFMSAEFDISKKFIIIKDLFNLKLIELNEFYKLKEIASYKFFYGIHDADLFGKTLIISLRDSRTLFIDLEKNKQIYERIQLESNNFLIKLPSSPYYMCSKDASKMLHYVTPSLKVIGFEQLDPIYNRPDIVLDSIGKYFGGADKEMVANYHQSWEKRIDRLGLDKEKLGKGEIAVPNAEIVGSDEIDYENTIGKIEIKVSANDAKYTLRRFNVYVNEVPVYRSTGISIAHLNKKSWDTTLIVPLSQGENKIQVSVMNELGLENFKYPTYVNYTPENKIEAKTHFIGIGVNEFKDASHNLTYCVKDVNDLAKEIGGEKTGIKIITNENVTRENILKLKQYLMDSTTVNDKVIISCSSHGLLDDSLNFFLATHDIDFDNPKTRGLKYEELENLLDGIPARQKLLLLDACNSGENDKTEILKKDLEQKQSRMDSIQVLAARGIIIELEEENKSNFKKMNELFVNVRNNTGSVIISAAGGQESALEAIKMDGEKIENGAFTYCVLEFLKTNADKTDILTVNKLKQYVENRVEEITNGKQKPTSRQETMEVDWGL